MTTNSLIFLFFFNVVNLKYRQNNLFMITELLLQI